MMNEMKVVAVAVASMTLLSLTLAGAGCGFSDYKCKTRQTEAKANLKALSVAMQAVKAESDKYPQTLAVLMAAGMMLDENKYEVRIVSVSDNAFVAEAVGKDEMAGDVWRVTESGQPTAVTNKCE